MKAGWPDHKAAVERWVMEQQLSNRGVSTTQIRLKAIQMAYEAGIVDFKGEQKWCL
ncbi:hypothetical protein DPMN_092597 [Dreissena polymorpha]|uniref:HTH CENPB-type domain-containing protein n=1 Tax=Dreissena polymorpha TaxID=45954 RepID=A0A9D4L225_DREPO|nr:hypothetical protein DPMN_092597 [Dreissena polymorpha]